MHTVFSGCYARLPKIHIYRNCNVCIKPIKEFKLRPYSVSVKFLLKYVIFEYYVTKVLVCSETINPEFQDSVVYLNILVLFRCIGTPMHRPPIRDFFGFTDASATAVKG